jgi:hypothetical protein
MTKIVVSERAYLLGVYERGWKCEENEVPQLYDIFLDGEWIGSRRTPKQCEQHIAWVTRKGG